MLTRSSLKKLVHEFDIVPFGISVLIPDYERVRSSHPRASMFMAKDAFEWVSQHVMVQAVKEIRTVDESPMISFITDTSNKDSRYREVYDGLGGKNPVSHRFIRELVFADDKRVAGLQVADMIASATNGVFRDYVKHGNINPDGFLVDGMYRISFADEKYLIKVLDAQSSPCAT